MPAGGPRHSVFQGNQVFGRMRVDGSTLFPVLAILGEKGFQLAAACLKLVDPALDRSPADPGTVLIKGLPLSLRSLSCAP